MATKSSCTSVESAPSSPTSNIQNILTLSTTEEYHPSPIPLSRGGSCGLLHSSSGTWGPPATISRKNSNANESKIVVLGNPAVGKSALVVRLLTGRFIWEYDPTLEASYKHHTSIDEDLVTMEILDTAGTTDGVCEGHSRWGEGFLLVYSLSDRKSFEDIPNIFQSIASVKQTNTFPCAIVANKLDLDHMCQVTDKEAEEQASNLGVALFFVSACNGGPEILNAFSEIHRDIVRRKYARRRKSSAKLVIEGFCKMFTR